jgi:nucleotide-binding universal stress UspA family protein
MKILIAVDGSKGARVSVDTCARLFASCPPETVVLLHVQQYGGGATLIHDRISDAELATLKEDLKGSEQFEKLGEQTAAVFTLHRKTLEEKGFRSIKTVVKSGHISEEILNTAKEEGADLIIIGNTRSMLDRLIMGDVTKEVLYGASVPVLLAK